MPIETYMSIDRALASIWHTKGCILQQPVPNYYQVMSHVFFGLKDVIIKHANVSIDFEHLFILLVFYQFIDLQSPNNIARTSYLYFSFAFLASCRKDSFQHANSRFLYHWKTSIAFLK